MDGKKMEVEEMGTGKLMQVLLPAASVSDLWTDIKAGMAAREPVGIYLQRQESAPVLHLLVVQLNGLESAFQKAAAAAAPMSLTGTAAENTNGKGAPTSESDDVEVVPTRKGN